MKYICRNCRRGFNKKFGSEGFCSLSCSRSFFAKQRHKNGKYKHHLSKLHLKRRKVDGWKCIVCNSIFETREKLIMHKKLKNHKIGGPGALKGKTKDTSKICKHISTTMVDGYKSGRIKHPFKGKHLSSKHREKISKGRIKTLDSNLKCGRRMDVGWYKVKNLNGVEYTVRGHWEENVAKKLNSIGIIWKRGKFLKYKKDIVHRYTPDFYLPSLNAFIEVKGYYPEEDQIKMKLVLDYNPKVKIYFLELKNYLDFIKNGILRQQFIL